MSLLVREAERGDDLGGLRGRSASLKRFAKPGDIAY